MSRIEIALLAAFFCVLIISAKSGISAVAPETISAVPELLKNARQANEQCESFFAKADETEGGLSTKESFPTKAIALKELTLAERYPGYPNASVEILDYLDSLPTYQTNIPDIEELTAAVSDCQSARFYGMLSRLIRSARVYRLGKADWQRISVVIANHIENDLGGVRMPLEISLNMKILDLARSAGIPIGRISSAKSRLAQENARSKEESKDEDSEDMEEAMATVTSPKNSSSFQMVNAQLLRDLKDELNEARELQGTLSAMYGKSPAHTP